MRIVLFAFIMILAPVDVFAQRGAPPAGVALQNEPRPPGTELVVVNANGKGTPLPGLNPAWQYSDPILSPDGKRLALSATRGERIGRGSPPPDSTVIITYTLPSGPAVYIVTPGQNILPSWVGNTGEIAFVRRASGPNPVNSLIVRKADGTGDERVLLGGLSISVTGSAWTEDGKHFFLAHHGTRESARGEIIFYSLDRLSSPQTFLANRTMPSRPVLSPDGGTVAFSARPLGPAGNPAGTPAVYIMRFSGGPAVVVSATGDYPAWSSDGNRLFFMSTNSRMIYSSRIRPGRTLTADEASVVSEQFEFPTSAFAVLPGNSQFVIRRRRLPVVTGPIRAAVRGVPADSATQLAIEIAAAHALVPAAKEKDVDLTKLAVESRSYIFLTDPSFAGFAQEIRSYLLPGRDEAHLTALARVLGAAGHIGAMPGCPVTNSPLSCRRGSFVGAVDFSPAVVSADSARIYSHAWVSDSDAVGTLYSWSFTMVRRGQDWVLKRVE